MHIAYLSPAWPPSDAANGVVTYVAAIRRHLIDAGHQVSVVAGGRLHRADGDAIGLGEGAPARGLLSRIGRRLAGDRGDQPEAARRLAAEIGRAHAIAGFDVIEMEESFGWPRAIRRAVDVPVAVRLHGPEFFLRPVPRADRRTRRRVSAEGLGIGAAAAVSAPSAATLAATRARYPRAFDRAGPAALVIPNPVTPVAPADAWRRAPPDDETILFVGRFDRAKGADTLIDAFSLLAPARPAARLVIVGPDVGLDAGDGVRLGFEGYARRRIDPAIRARIRFTGVLPPPAIARLRRSAAVTVVASRAETFCYAAAEAMAAGCPLVMSDWAGSAEIVEHGVSGWITPMGDARALATRMGWLLDRPEIAAAAGAAARARCETRFAADAVGPHLAALYRRMLRAR